MNESTILHSVPAAGELHKVPGFDPMKYLRGTVNDKGEPVKRLEPRYQRLWFRLACPKGRMLLNPLRITDQLAIFEAKVFFHRDDATPASSFTANKTAQETADYIRAAQEEALMAALDDAGFGIQLCDVTQTSRDSGRRPAVTPAKSGLEQGKPPQARAQAEPASIREVPPVPPVQAPRGTTAAEMASGPAPSARVVPMSVQTAESTGAAENIPDPAPTATSADEEVDPSPTLETAPDQTESQNVLGTVQHGEAAASDARQSKLTDILDFPTQAVGGSIPQDPAADAVSDTVDGRAVLPADATASQEEAPPKAEPSYTEAMPVEEICQVMTMEEARSVVVTKGTCSGWTMGQVAEQRPSSLRFYLSGLGHCTNVQLAAATLLQQTLELKKAG